MRECEPCRPATEADHDQSGVLPSVNGGSELGVGSSHARFYWVFGLAGTVGAFELLDLPKGLVVFRIGLVFVAELGVQDLLRHRLGQSIFSPASGPKAITSWSRR